ncbi:Prefoldin subunit 5 [Saguinus oedipus]|uniref:Prefoldin subunit 5 n=1 Tax=Saguinus oedipus TaxID=9490 RepID=A0ABQ9UNT7_SAGOE|nr:Prefoldin subunit 5 [Saguinus oedipus]
MEDGGYFEHRDFHIALKRSLKVKLEGGAGSVGEGEEKLCWGGGRGGRRGCFRNQNGGKPEDDARNAQNQLDQEVEFLSTSIAQLKVVQTKYVEAKDCLNVLNKSNEVKELLVPLTSSMYVPGKLHDVEHVLIDVGTGYYVEKTAEDAKDFFKRKTDFLTKQMEKIQQALQEKHAMKHAVMEMMSQKIQQLTALGAAQATAKA